eukprot:CAMPEP_0172516778 /NCGR_PEP_ID=MMETSP1066-20121228/279040_1 /TAXON_ID=671091 /ORGANISM="Coscinodiscus wailesii, Strain CCMP2513" /LENGTH=229 /DNA_ID=CAMNT_0013298403 /DNA_START=81 /DNA_END=766 /DNA_ORIENTATION=-
MAKSTVTTLDLRKTGKVLTASDVARLVHRFRNLTSLDFSYNTYISDNHLLQLSPLAPTLTVLRLRGCRVTDDGIVTFLESRGDNWKLTELDVSAVRKDGSGCVGDAALVAITSRCPALRILEMGYRSRLTDDAARSLSQLTRLVRLDLSLCSLLTGAVCGPLSRLCDLRWLDLSATGLRGDGLQILAGGLERIEELVLRHLDQVSVETLEAFVMRDNSSLKVLDLSYCG